MIKAGDLFKNIENGKVFAVKSVHPTLVIFTTKDESHSLLVNPKSIESAFVPVAEDETPKNPNNK